MALIIVWSSMEQVDLPGQTRTKSSNTCFSWVWKNSSMVGAFLRLLFYFERTDQSSAGIANHVERLCRTRDVSNHHDLTARFYFSFENFSHQHNLESLLKSIIQQLSFAPEIFSRLKEL